MVTNKLNRREDSDGRRTTNTDRFLKEGRREDERGEDGMQEDEMRKKNLNENEEMTGVGRSWGKECGIFFVPGVKYQGGVTG